MQYVRSRKREIRRAIKQSSPALIWSGSLGIVVIAPVKSPIQNRIGKMLDRIAMISRGELIAGQLLHKQAASEAYAAARILSRGGVGGDVPVQAVSTLLSRHFQTPIGETLPVEACIVQLQASQEQDYLAYIDADGHTELFQKIRYLGSLEKKEHLSGVREEAALQELQKRIAESWRDWPTIEDLVQGFRAVPELATVMSGGVRRDVVLLDREAFRQGAYEIIWKRFSEY